jgi:hypothetical protein
MNDWLKTLLPILLALLGGYITLERRLANIETALAITDVRMDFYFGEDHFMKPGHGGPVKGAP